MCAVTHWLKLEVTTGHKSEFSQRPPVGAASILARRHFSIINWTGKEKAAPYPLIWPCSEGADFCSGFDPDFLSSAPSFEYWNVVDLMAVDGGWTEWTNWGDCDCDAGTKTRTRTCTNPPPSGGGEQCQGKGSESKNCEGGDCGKEGKGSGRTNTTEVLPRTAISSRWYSRKWPKSQWEWDKATVGVSSVTYVLSRSGVDGGWTEWTNWGDCDCDAGTKTRTRTCTNPPPSGGGEQCQGKGSESKNCEGGDCGKEGTSRSRTNTPSEILPRTAISSRCSRNWPRFQCEWDKATVGVCSVRHILPLQVLMVAGRNGASGEIVTAMRELKQELALAPTLPLQEEGSSAREREANPRIAKEKTAVRG